MLSSHLTALMFLLATVLAASCRATEPTTDPAPAPTGLQAAVTIAHADASWSAEILWTNPTDHGLSIGHYLSYCLTRTDVTPAVVVAASPEHAMTPHYRILLPAHQSQKSALTFWDKPDSLVAGTYQLTITYPRDMVSSPVEQRFTVPASEAPAPGKG